MTLLLAFALKRVALARLFAVQGGTAIIAGTSALLGPDVQIAPIMPADPDRVAVYFAPVRSTRRTTTAELVSSAELVTMEIRVRVFTPGVDDEDASTVEQTLDDVCNAVARSLLDGPRLAMGEIWVSNVIQWPTAVQAQPEPGITGLASLIISGNLVAS